MSLEFHPVELGFRRPFATEVEEKLRLKNPNSSPVAFKVKTTAPKQYCVRPNSGRIAAGQEIEVSVLLQAMKEEPPADTKCRDKFLVQSVILAPSDETTNVAAVWANTEQTGKSLVQERKIRVNFLPATSSNTPPPRSTGAGDPLYDHDIAARRAQTSTAETPSASMQSTITSGDGDKGRPGIDRPVADSSDSQPTDIINSQLPDPQIKTAKSVGQASEGLRQRKTSAVGDSQSPSSGFRQTPLQQATVGVSVPIVAALCLLSFLLAYMLF